MQQENFKPITLSELLQNKYPKTEWLVDGLIPSGEITIISAYPGNYKTWLMLDIAVCAAQGIDFLDKFKTKKSKILIVDEESCEKSLQKRFQQITSQNNLDIEILSFSNFDLLQTDKLISYCQGKNIDVVMIDSLIRVHKLRDENSSTEMAKIFDQLKKFKQKNISLILLHHNRKTGFSGGASAEDMRGSSEIFAATDCALSLSKGSEGVSVYQTKLKIEEEHAPFLISITRTENNTSFKYLRDIKIEERKSKPQIAREQIVKLLKENDSLTKTELKELLPQNISNYAVKTAFKELLQSNSLNIETIEDEDRYSLILE